MSKAQPRLNVVAPLRFWTVAQRIVGRMPTVTHVTALGAPRAFCGLKNPERGGSVNEPERGDRCTACFATARTRQHRENEKALRLW